MKNVLRSTLALFGIALIVITGSDLAHAVNNALDFDGTNAYVNVPDNDIFDFTSFTVEAWICPTVQDLADNHAVIGKSNAEWLPASTGFSLENAGTLLYGSVWDASGTEKYIQAGTLAPGIWQHVAMTWTSGGSLILYINGNYVGQQSSTFSGTIANGGSLKIGVFTWVLGRYWDGQIDEVRIWNDVRTQPEIRANMYQEISDPSSETNLVAYYKFNEGDGDTTAVDSKGGNDGTLTNMKGDEWETSPAMFGPKNALDFDGTDDYVKCGAVNLSGSTLTLEGWVNADNFDDPGQGCISLFGTEQDGHSAFLRLGDCGYNLNKVQFVIFVGGGQKKLDGNFVLQANTWYHVAGVYDSSSGMKIYINGKLDVSNSQSGSVTSNSYLFIGNNKEGDNRFFDGTIDEVRAWSTARTPAEIRENMCKNLTGNESGLVAYYSFDNSSGTKLQDFSGNANDGTLYNMDNSDWVSSSAFNTWLNTSSSDWSTATNWSRGSAPATSAPYDNVGIYNYSSEPNISGNPTFGSLYLGSGISTTLTSAMTVNNSLILDKDLDLNGQTITLGSS